MSLWYSGPSEDSLDQQTPPIPTESSAVPRCLRSVIQFQFVRVACGGAHCMALTADGKLFAWGWNEMGQLGLGEEAGPCVHSPRVLGRLFGRTVGEVSCGAAHTVALVEDNSADGGPEASCLVYAWGAHHAGQLGHSDTVMKEKSSFDGPAEVEQLRGIAGRLSREGEPHITNASGEPIAQPLSCGLGHTALIGVDGTLWTWGANGHGQCASQKVVAEGESSSSTPVCKPGRVHALVPYGAVWGVACGSCHTLALVYPGRVYAFGLNATGQIGDGENHPQPCPTPTLVRLPASSVVTWVACGEEYSAAVTSEGQLFMWGFGGLGQLGLGNTGSMRVPRQVMCEPIEQIACGGGLVLARTVGDQLLTWGYPGTYQQAKAAAESRKSGGAPAAAEAGSGVRFDLSRPSTTSSPISSPILLPLPIDLQASSERPGSATTPTAGNVAGSCRHVSCGRFHAVFVGEPVEPMPENDAALMIQCSFRKDQSRKDLKRRSAQKEAAAVIGGRASEYLARKAVMQTAQANARKEKDLAATRVQAHQRRRMQAKQAEDARKAKEAKLKKQETDQRFADWATGANVEATVGLDETLSKQSGGLGKLSQAAPKPPAQKRTGGGFVRKK